MSGSPSIDGSRRTVLEETGFLDEAAEEALDRFTRLAAALLDAPVAQLNVITDDRQVTKSVSGPEPWASVRSVPLTHSFCQHLLELPELLVEDAREHPLVCENSATTEAGVVAYAGVPVRVPGGMSIGSLCVVDFVSRQWTQTQLDALRDLAGGVESEIALRLEIVARRRAEGRAEELNRELEDRVAKRTAELAEAGDRLIESEQRFRSLFEHNPQAVYVIDKGGRVQAMNPAAEELLGATPEALLGRPFSELISPEDLDAAWKGFEGVLRGEVTVLETKVVRGDGRLAEVRAVSAPLFVDGQIEGVIGVAEDVTERKELEAQLRQSQKMEALGRLAGGVAHDLNNVLTAIRGYAQLLMEESLGGSHPARPDVREIDRAAEHATGLTRQLLAFSRKQALRARVIRLDQTVTDIERMLRRVIGDDIELRWAPSEALPAVRADPGQVEQILINLVVNARDAMPAGGVITISTEEVHLEHGDVPVFVGPDPTSWICLAVADTGTGMTPDVLERIFEPFFTTKPEGKGTGLGLSTVYGIVRQSGGFIRVDSSPGQGTAFRVYLPVTSDAVAEPEPGLPAPKHASSGEVVLLVEDEDAVRSVARRILERDGYTVLPAASGEEALAICEGNEGPIHAVVSDISMPGMTGMEIIRRVRELRPGTGLLLMSGYTAEEMTLDALEAGVGFLEKPFTPETLRLRVKETCSRADTEQE